MKFEIYKTPPVARGLIPTIYHEWRWRLRASNGEIVASGEGYTSKQNCLHAIALVMDTNRQTPMVEAIS